MVRITKKRFYYNTFYHADDMNRVLEYEIIDRQSYLDYPDHNEKEDIPQWYIYIGENDSGWQDMLVDLLNALHEENELLQKTLDGTVELLNKKLIDCPAYYNLMKTNQQQKETIKKIQEIKRLEKAEILANQRGELIGFATSLIEDLGSQEMQEMWTKFREKKYKEWRGLE